VSTAKKRAGAGEEDYIGCLEMAILSTTYYNKIG